MAKRVPKPAEQLQSAKSMEEEESAEEKRRKLIREQIEKFLQQEATAGGVDVNMSMSRPTLRADDRCRTYVDGVNPKPGDILQVGDVVQNRFKIVCKLREGAFGQIYSVWDEKLKDECALKIEPVEENEPFMEAFVLLKFCLSSHCPKLYGIGKWKEKFNFAAMQLLGRNLTELRHKCRFYPPRLSLSTSVRLVLQGFRAIETLHNLGFLHRDVKPSNMAMGTSKTDEKTLFIIDFGLARRYVAKNGSLRPARSNAGFRGTLRYASLNAHDSVDMSRRDDMISMFYTYFELLIGELPWSQLNDRQKVAVEKRKNPPDSLCKWMPKENTVIARLICRLRFEDTPNYDSIVAALVVSMKRFRIGESDSMDWQVADCKSLRHWTVATDIPDR